MLDHYLFSEKVGLEDVTGTLALFLLAGPNALTLGERLAGTRPAEPAWSHAAGDVDGTPVRVVRGAGETGEPEVWLVAAAGAAAALWSAIRDAGARPVGRRAFEPLRIEAGTPRFGADVGPSVLLPEIPSGPLVSYSKGCYPGQEVVVRIRDRGHVNRRLRGLVLDGATVPAPGSEVVAGGAVVGVVTSAALSPGLERPVALAFVRREHAAAGTAVAVRAGEAAVPAVVSDLPLSATRDRAAAGPRR
jgi:folate-binding protein YgfZ